MSQVRRSVIGVRTKAWGEEAGTTMKASKKQTTTATPSGEVGRPTVGDGVDGNDDNDDNFVRVRGRLSRDPEVRTLPSGDELVLLRVVVDRPDGDRADSLPVAVGPPPGRGRRRRPGQADATTIRRAARLRAGARVEVQGWIQRRFWDAGASGRRSRLQIVAVGVRQDRSSG
jgi:single-strand DNA-binding protein